MQTAQTHKHAYSCSLVSVFDLPRIQRMFWGKNASDQISPMTK